MSNASCRFAQSFLPLALLAFGHVCASAHAAEPAITPAQREFRAFQPVRNSSPPAVLNSIWVKTPIDAFVLSRLEAEGIAPSSPAGDLELIRRVSFDLTGLPPSHAEIDQYLADTAPGAYERMVERYLASPAYGERWAQHWLDVVRFGETEGFEYDRQVTGL